MSLPPTKTSIIQGFMAAGEWRKAISAASKLPRLDRHRAAILRAQDAYTNPGFAKSLGRNPDDLIAAGIAALKERFGEPAK